MSIPPKEVQFRGYELINPPFAQAAVAMISQLGCLDALSEGTASLESLSSSLEQPRYLEAALNFLEAQGYLSLREGNYKITDCGTDFFSHADEFKALVADYHRLTLAVKLEIGDVVSDELDLNLNSKFDLETLTQAQQAALMVPAVTYLHESKMRDGRRASELLLKGETLNPDLIQVQIEGNRALFIKVLEEGGLLEGSEDTYTLTKKGKKMLSLGGYAELTLSYYHMLQEMTALSKGEKTYGLSEDVSRDTELNARASNGIIELRVAPALVQSLAEEPILMEALGLNGAFIDYGSGGADMLMQVAKNGPDSIKNLFGVDLNPETNELAKKLVSEAELDNIDLVTGSITDSNVLEVVKARMEAAGLRDGVASINFILHDIGPELARQFLSAHAQVFPNVPLLITETLSMSAKTLMTYPNYQAASFQFMHTASGQHLYTEQELRALLEECGYELVSKKVHSSMPSKDGSERLDTIVTWVTRPKVNIV